MSLSLLLVCTRHKRWAARLRRSPSHRYRCARRRGRGGATLRTLQCLALALPPTPCRRARAPAVGRFSCLARRRCRVQSQAIVRWKARLTVLAVVLAVRLYAAARASYGPVKLGLRHAVSAYRGGPWEQWARAGAAQGSIIASGTLRGSRRYPDDAQWHFDELGVLGGMNET